MEARISLYQDRDELGVFLKEPGHGHHHVSLDVTAHLPIPQEHEVLAPRLGREGALLEGQEGAAGGAKCSRILQHQTAVQVKCSGQVACIVLVCRSTVNNEELKANKFRG